MAALYSSIIIFIHISYRFPSENVNKQGQFNYIDVILALEIYTLRLKDAIKLINTNKIEIGLG